MTYLKKNHEEVGEALLSPIKVLPMKTLERERKTLRSQPSSVLREVTHEICLPPTRTLEEGKLEREESRTAQL